MCYFKAVLSYTSQKNRGSDEHLLEEEQLRMQLSVCELFIHIKQLVNSSIIAIKEEPIAADRCQHSMVIMYMKNG